MYDYRGRNETYYGDKPEGGRDSQVWNDAGTEHYTHWTQENLHGKCSQGPSEWDFGVSFNKALQNEILEWILKIENVGKVLQNEILEYKVLKMENVKMLKRSKY